MFFSTLLSSFLPGLIQMLLAVFFGMFTGGAAV